MDPYKNRSTVFLDPFKPERSVRARARENYGDSIFAVSLGQRS